MRLRSPFVVVLCLLTASLIVSAVACSSAGPRPEAGNTDREGGASSSTSSSGSTRTDSGGDGASGEGGEAGLPDTCANTIKDGAETDTDCGGNVCGRCIDGKACIADTDCAGGACLNKLCVTPKCTDLATNGDESDVDCGGAICAKCTIGKRCKAPTDCVSGACVNEACTCPKGMTTASRQGGNGAYCIDEIEVTKGQYNKFITANVNINDQIDVCKPPANPDFIPRGAWPPAVAPPNNPQPGEGLAFNYSLPVHYVNWCDAHAYCKWANKQLCGAVTGGAVAPALADQADASAWYNACSAQGNKEWPYGTIFEGRCNGNGGGPGLSGDAGPVKNQFGGYGFGGANQDQGIHQLHNGDTSGNYTLIYFGQCQGAVTGLYQMSGNVAEWEDSCNGTAADSLCRVRGGSFFADDDPTTLGCKGMRVEKRLPPEPAQGEEDVLRDIGFRCCLY